MLSTRDPPQNKGHMQIESEGLEKHISCKRRTKESRSRIVISDKIDFQIKAVKRDKERHYIMIKGSIQEGDMTIINICAPNIGAPQHVRQILTSMKEEINNNTIIVGDLNTPLTPMDRSNKEKISKETQALNDTIGQLELIDIYRAFHQKKTRVQLFLKFTWNILQDRLHPGP